MAACDTPRSSTEVGACPQLVEADRRRAPAHVCALAQMVWLALRHLKLCRCHAAVGVCGLSHDRAVSTGLWHDTVV